MKIVVVGTRGIPEIQGGVETHCQQLYPRLAAMGHDVTVIRRSSYVTADNRCSEYRGVKIKDVFAPRKKSFEAIIHTFLAVLKARRMNPDVLHVHAIGPGLMVPFARLLGMKVVSTNHGPDYDRGKWGKLAKTVLKAGEKMAAKYSNRVIVISTVIAGILRDKYGRADTDLIFNGVEKPEKATTSDYISSLGLEPGKYIVALGRFVPEKGFHDLIEAYKRGDCDNCKLVIAGDADHPDAYSENLKKIAAETSGVVLTGFIRGKKLNEIMSHAALFAMPSYHEGLPIALLEAMSYDLDVAVSDIPANKLDCLDADDFFHVGDVDELAELLKRKLSASATPRNYDLTPYDWDVIARQTEAVYRKALEK